MTVSSTLLKDKLLVTGWVLILLSALIFYFAPEKTDTDFFSGLSLLHFITAVAYVILPSFNRRTRSKANRKHYHAVKLILLLISAYALNRDIPIFFTSTPWLCVLLVMICVNYLVSAFMYDLPQPLQYVSFFVHGVAFLLFLYLSIYLLPIYAFSVVALLALGFSVHAFGPLIFAIYTVRFVGWMAEGQRRWWVSFGTGIATAFLICIVYIVTWSTQVNRLNKSYHNAFIQGHNELPAWVQVAQHTDHGALSEKVLKTDLIYRGAAWGGDLFWNPPTRNFGDERLHDPLVTMGTMLARPLALPEEDRIKVLESGYTARHQALKRLWTGVDLITTQVLTQVKVWPDLHLAYTEKVLTVSNNRKRNLRAGDEEAIYTFHLPEGGVVTALSLWINGREEKAVLTSKSKADEAYTTIVGVERHDPSIVHWQEGNTVSVRVFPVGRESSRLFKIGITAPLRETDGQLAYDNTWFEGPDASDAREVVAVDMQSAPRSFLRAASYSNGYTGNTFTTTRRYQPVWTLDFQDIGLKPHSFSFDGNRYSILPYQKQRVPAAITDVYLDINRAWKASEVEAVLKTVEGKRVWVYTDSLRLLTDDNRDALLTSLSDQQFSLFPFHLVPDRAHALVISKSGDYSPNITDLEGSPFLRDLAASANGKRIRLFHLGTEMSPYLRSLNEFRLFDFESGRVELLQKLLEHGQFAQVAEGDNAVVIHSAGVVITKTPGEAPSDAPDHLMRLFAYNHILQQMGAGGLHHRYEDSTLVAEANKAYVVSPVSSLVVLESQQDYERFGIKDGEISLKNASHSNQGAVPEPVEWAIILLSLLGFGFFLYKSRSL